MLRRWRSPKISIRSVTSVRGGEHEPFRVGVRAGASGRDLHGLDTGAGQDRVEGAGELPGTVADQEPEVGGAVAEVHQEVPDLLGGPGPVWVRGHAEDVLIAGANLDHEEAVQALQGHRAVDVKRSPPQALSRLGCAGTAARLCRYAASAPEGSSDP